MSSYNVSYIYAIKDRFSRQAAKIKAQTNKVAASFDKLKGKVESASKKMGSMGKNMALKVSAPLVGVAALALKSTANMEKLEVQLKSMTGSAAVGAELLNDLKVFSASTPFQIEGLGQSAKQLLASGVAVDEIKDKLKFLGDIAAGTGKPISNITAIFAKLKNRGKASLEELNQLSEAGVPILDILAKGYRVSKEEVMEMSSKGKISFAVMQAAMQSVTEKGGIFNDMMSKQSETLSGLWSTLTDNIGLFLAELGVVLVDTLDLRNVMVKVIDTIKSMTVGIAKFAKEHPTLTKIALVFAGIAAVIGPVLIALAAIAPLIMGAVPAVIALSGFLLPIIGITGAIAAAFIGVGVAVYQLKKHWDTIFGGGAIETLKAFGGYIKEVFSKAFGFIGEKISKITSIFKALGFGDTEHTLNENKTMNMKPLPAQEVVSRNSLNGKIVVEASQGTAVRNVSSVSTGNASLDLGLGYGG